jgi:hypothetical protein
MLAPRMGLLAPLSAMRSLAATPVRAEAYRASVEFFRLRTDGPPLPGLSCLGDDITYISNISLHRPAKKGIAMMTVRKKARPPEASATGGGSNDREIPGAFERTWGEVVSVLGIFSSERPTRMDRTTFGRAANVRAATISKRKRWICALKSATGHSSLTPPC